MMDSRNRETVDRLLKPNIPIVFWVNIQHADSRPFTSRNADQCSGAMAEKPPDLWLILACVVKPFPALTFRPAWSFIYAKGKNGQACG